MYRYSSNHHNRNYYRKPLWKTTGFYFLLLLIVAFVFLIYWSISDAEPAAPLREKVNEVTAPALSAKIIFAEGQVELRKEGGAIEEVGVDYQIQTGDTLKTGAASRVVVELPDKSVARLSENAEVKFQTLGLADIVLLQNAGHVFHRVNAASTAIYRVQNGFTELTALGTGFDVLASQALTYLTVTESRVKVKIFDENGNVINMRTVEQGTKATVNTSLSLEKNIQTETINAADLQENAWFAWNLEQDRASENYLGIFSSSLKLVIKEPSGDKPTFDDTKFHLRGETEQGAQVFVSGTELENNQGVFESDIAISPGENEIEITVKKDREQSKKTLTVVCSKQTANINLTAKVEKNSVTLNWTVDNASEFKEFKILHDTEAAPSYPDATYHTAAKNVSTDTWPNLARGKHYFRVCLFTAENKCAAYGPETSVEISENAVAAGLSLTATTQGNNIKLSWTLNDENTESNGFKTIISDKSNPTYPGNSYHSLADNARNDTWKNLSPGNYHFRVCLLRNDECVSYSNDAGANVDASAVPRITLSGAADGAAVSLNWTAENFEAPQGFKALMSDTAGIGGLGQNHHLITSATAVSDTWDGLTPGKTYYFKVCQNLSGNLGTCSNEIEIQL